MDRRCLVILLFVAVHVVHGAGKLRGLTRRPPGMKTFDVERYMGRWYIMATLNPCSWNGANRFTNWVNEFSLDKDTGEIFVQDMWRSGKSCVSAPVLLKMTGASCYKFRDTIGDVSSGDAVIVATDYKTFCITWGCTKYIGDECQDPWMDVDTRAPILTGRVKRIADTILKQVMGIKMSDLQTMSHAKPCRGDRRPIMSMGLY